MARYCPRCNEVHPAGMRCPQRKQNWVHNKRYDQPEYRRNRQKALERTSGKCARCGKKIAEKHNNRWHCLDGDVHHMTPLAKGGGHNEKNLVPLCRDCHLSFHRM